MSTGPSGTSRPTASRPSLGPRGALVARDERRPLGRNAPERAVADRRYRGHEADSEEADPANVFRSHEPFHCGSQLTAVRFWRSAEVADPRAFQEAA